MIILFCGKSGSEKSAVFRHTIKTAYNCTRIIPVTPYTTRPAREYETNGIEYNFISENEFVMRTKTDSMFESRTYSIFANGHLETWKYGFPNIVDTQNPFRHYAAVVDIEAAKSFINLYGTENCYVIMINSSDNDRKDRIARRGNFSETEWRRRLHSDTEAFSGHNTKGVIDAFVEHNGDLDAVFAETDRIIETVLNRQQNTDCIRFYGTDNLLADKLDSITADDIRHLITKIPGLDIELRANHPVDILDRKGLLNATASNHYVRKYISGCSDTESFERNCIAAIVAVALELIEDIPVRIFCDRHKMLFVTDTDPSHFTTDNNIDLNLTRMKNVLNTWVNFLFDNCPVNVECKELYAKVTFI